jgi:hypothetical protein
VRIPVFRPHERVGAATGGTDRFPRPARQIPFPVPRVRSDPRYWPVAHWWTLCPGSAHVGPPWPWHAASARSGGACVDARSAPSSVRPWPGRTDCDRSSRVTPRAPRPRGTSASVTRRSAAATSCAEQARRRLPEAAGVWPAYPPWAAVPDARPVDPRRQRGGNLGHRCGQSRG